TTERRLPLPVAACKTSAVFPIPVMRPFDRILMAMRSERLGESDKRTSLPYDPQVLARLIKKLKPDLIHSMEFQHAGYNVLRTKELMGNRKFPKWLATNWGSDIYYYQRFPDHYQQISRLLKQIDYYSCECTRAIGLAREMGMQAKAMPVLPNTGGFDIEAIAPQRAAMQPSNRRMIMVKGYQHFAGRSLTALDALQACAESLRDYRIVVFSASSTEVADRVEELKIFHGLNIHILPHSDHGTMLKYFAHARIYLGVSISDAISTSMLEAMAMGAFPIQTTTACCEEWNEDGVSGFHIPPDDVEFIADRIRRAIADDALVDSAAAINWQTVMTRLDQDILRVKEVDFYNEIFADMTEDHGA
ncbi:MAG: glycosyltransferase family 4 protein, partial [Rickettsiales bacterium]|nr:glycosyltransferase family 4 protein [Rickettsiales bacterium]